MFIEFGSKPPIPEFDKSGPHLANYRRVYNTSEDAVERLGVGPEALAKYLAMYDRLGARHVVVKARDLETTFGFRIANEDVAAFCHAHGPRFLGFAGADPHKGIVAIRELEFAVRELGLRGLNLQCFEHKLAINDKKMYPLYAKCIELDIPVNIHASINFSTDTLMEYGHPRLLDEVMVHFPDLRVCASPPGWPWVQELIGVAWRHKNVSIGLVAVRPRVLGIANSGYEPLLQYGNTILQDRIIFGSAYPMQPVERALAEIDALALKPEVRRKWVHDNAARFLGLNNAPGSS
ncbi:MAG: amidohydrolase [Alphaproteobacteria bacterium]|nr:amidohydrolase [Alphaproteobacteria bacterium]